MERSDRACGSGTGESLRAGSVGLVLAIVLTLLGGAPFAAAAPSWSIQRSADDGATPNYLVATSCLSPGFCMAVGHYSDQAGDDHALIETWNGTSWEVLPSPAAGSAPSDLTGVSCLSITSCWAVGYDGQGSADDQTLVESWNGTAWSIVPSPNSGPGSGLNGVTCTSGGPCIAVGYGTLESTVAQTLVESWDGTDWSIIASPDVGSNGNVLDGVSCTSGNSCMAVGQYATVGGYPEQTLAVRWNGATWAVVATPDRDKSETNSLDSVSCAGPQFCMAVGEYPNTHHSASTLSEMWNGASWTVVPSQDEATGNSLYGVSCTAPRQCLAVGRGARSGNQPQTMVERWNGTGWQLVASPPRGVTSTLAAVACISSHSCDAVGFSLNNSTARTLVEVGGG